MAIFSFNDSNGKSFDIKGPAGLTLEQAKRIFDTQSSSGALVGLKPGSILSAASQAKAGLTSALAQVGQSLSGITGALGSGIASAAGAIGSAASGALAGAKSIADKALSAVTGAKAGAVTNGIDIAKFAKTDTALAPIAGMSVPQVTGALAQAKNLVGQAASKMTDSKGLGSFGLDAKQLETAGILKPGMSNLVTSGAATLTKVLKSPAAFTGKNGIKSAGDLLSNPGAQSNIQQDLMAKGTAGLAAVGASISNFNPSDAAGLALNAAKSLPNTEALIKGLPLPADIKSTMTSTIKGAAFAVSLTDKIPAAFKAEILPVPAADTANRETLNAASNRILGNQKIPSPSYSPKPVDAPGEVAQIEDAYSEAISYVVGATADLVDLQNELTGLNKQATVSQAEFDAINAAYTKIKNAYNTTGLKIVFGARSIRESKSTKAQLESNSIVAEFNTFSSKLVEVLAVVQKLLKEVESKLA